LLYPPMPPIQKEKVRTRAETREGRDRRRDGTKREWRSRVECSLTFRVLGIWVSFVLVV
jgi:hypothetical protein